MRRPLEAISRAASISRAVRSSHAARSSSAAWSWSAVLLLALALAGCGGSSPASPASFGAKSTKSAATGKGGSIVSLTSSAITGTEIPARYTCDGENIAPPLKWGEVPSSSKEVVLFAIAVPPRGSRQSTGSVEWAMAGVKPTLHELSAGELPPGAFLEQASDGQRHYSICPPKGQTRRYAFILYAVPPLVRVSSHINGARLLRNLTEGIPQYLADAVGEFSASYTRR